MENRLYHISIGDDEEVVYPWCIRLFSSSECLRNHLPPLRTLYYKTEESCLSGAEMYASLMNAEFLRIGI